jgi:hypothetical protein
LPLQAYQLTGGGKADAGVDTSSYKEYFAFQSLKPETLAVTREELIQDLAYARTLAEEGRQTPLIGGSYLVLFGVLLAIAYGAQYAGLAGMLPRDQIGFIWIGFGACALIGSLALTFHTRGRPGASSLSNRADRAIWQGVACAIMFVVFGAVLRGVLYDDYTATSGIMAAGFGLYGVALYATATVSGHMWLRRVAWLSWSVSFTLWLFLGENWAYLAASIGAVLVLLIPGLILMRSEPSKVV